MPIWTLAKKELRLLARDRLGFTILFVMPLVFVMILGLLTGEGFGQKPDTRLRISLLDLDRGYPDNPAVREAMTWLALPPTGGGLALPALTSGAVARQMATRQMPDSWAKVVQRDLELTEGIRIEIIHSREEAEELTSEGKRPAVVVFGPEFSDRVTRCSFLDDKKAINPFYRDGVNLAELDAELLADPTQITASSIIGQVAQVTLLRVILPWMIGGAFERLTDKSFMSMLADEIPGGRLLSSDLKASLGRGVQGALKKLFSKYDLTGMNWTDLTKSKPKEYKDGIAQEYMEEGGKGFYQKGAVRYQIIVPSMTVMFAFVLVLTVGWLFVVERHQGTLKRLRAAPLTRVQILVGKLLPCLAVSFFQGVLLLIAGKFVFGMRWGPDSWSPFHQAVFILPVVLATSFAAMGLALLVAVLARTEIQVAICGTLLVLILALLGGCLVPRGLMPENMQRIMLITPNAWALDAYSQLFLSPTPNLMVVLRGCAVLTLFGAGFLQVAWWRLRLD
jgi:ABC-type multidrug transport system permease subunit